MEEIFASFAVDPKKTQIHHPANLFPLTRPTLPCVKYPRKFPPAKIQNRKTAKFYGSEYFCFTLDTERKSGGRVGFIPGDLSEDNTTCQSRSHLGNVVSWSWATLFMFYFKSYIIMLRSLHNFILFSNYALGAIAKSFDC